MHLLVNQVLQFWLRHLDQLNEKWVNFEMQFDPLGYDCE